MIFKRSLASTLTRSLKERRSVLLLGPRQTGKSTLIKEVLKPFSHTLEYPLQLPSVRTSLELDPERIRREVEAKDRRYPTILFVDEIQKVPALLDVLQYLLDEGRATLVASGSSARKMRQGARNWLPGRIHLNYLNPLTWEESGLDPRIHAPPPLFLEDRMLFGGLPGILRENQNEVRSESLRSYTTLYLEEEIRQEAAVRQIPPFAQFLRLAALESGTSPNMSKIASQVGVSHTTVAEYYRILEDSLILRPLPSYGNSRSSIFRRPKYYFFDLGVRNAAADVGHGKAVLALQPGLLFEHCVFLQIISCLSSGTTFSYWRTKTGEEVDLILEKEGKTTAIEIKWTDRPSLRDFSGLAAFQKLEKCDEAFLICRIPREQKFAAGLAVPWWRMAHFLFAS